MGHVTFATTGELVMGTVTLAHFARRFERELGSRKFVLWVLESFVISLVLIWTAAVVMMMHHTPQKLHYAGPYPTLGALLYLYYKYTPRLHPRFFGIVGFHVSEKIILYAFAVQVILFQGKSTVIPAVCGIMAGWFSILYTVDVPNMIADSLTSCFRKVVDAPPPLVAPALMAASRQRQQPPHQAVRHNTATRPVPQPPSQANIDQLTAMGFEREMVVRALQQTNNNVEQALDRLLTGSRG